MTLHCCDQNRRRLVADHPTLNGIDHLEVIDADLPSGDPLRQRTLLLRLLKPPPQPKKAAGQPDLSFKVVIRGGERRIDPLVSWVALASSSPPALDPLAHPEEKAVHELVAALPEPEQVLVIRCRERGDFSTYRLRLQRADNDEAPPAWLDPQLAEVAFSFKVECPSELDCLPEHACPPEQRLEPPIDYLARDYPSLRRLVLDRLTQLVPDWRERSAADLGVVLAELIAYVADQLSYQLDAIGTEAYLDTARLRTSLRRHALLVDYHLDDGCNARVWLHLPTGAQAPESGIALPPEPLRFLTRLPDLPRRLVPGSREEQEAMAADPLVFESLPTAHPTTLHLAHNRIDLHTWGDDRCCLPAGSTRATLVGHLPNLKPGDPLLFEEVLGPLTGAAADADPRHRHVVRLTSVQAFAPPDPAPGAAPVPLRDPLPIPPLMITEVAWAPEDALPFALCLSATSEDGRTVEKVSVARGNLVLADHGLSLPSEDLGAVPQPRLSYPPERDQGRCELPAGEPIPPRYNPGLSRAPLTFVAPPVDPSQPVATLAGSGLGTTAALWLEQGPPDASGAPPSRWFPLPDLLSCGADDRCFVAEVEHDGSTRLRFGDDVHGRRPDPGTRFLAHARIGNGRSGNVGAGAIAHLVASGPAVESIDAGGIRNPLPAFGGRDPEDAAAVRRRAPQAFRSQKRAVTPADYAFFAERFPGVQRAAASLRWTGSWHTVFLTVDRLGGVAIDPAFEAALLLHLEPYRMAGHDLEINDPIPVPLEVGLHVCVKPGHLRAHVRARLLAVLGNRRLADGRLGHFHPDRWSFGQTVYLSGIQAAARSVPGVASVDVTTFQRQGLADPSHRERGFLALSRLEIPRLDNDRNHPDRGVLLLDLNGGN